MKIGKLAGKAKDIVGKRGGTDSLKEDAQELKEIAGGRGSLKDKAKAAGAALKKPGAEEQQAEQPVRPQPPAGGGAAPPEQR